MTYQGPHCHWFDVLQLHHQAFNFIGMKEIFKNISCLCVCWLDSFLCGVSFICVGW